MDAVEGRKTLILSYLKTTLAFSPVFFVFGCYVIWLYLNELGRLDVFTRVIHQQFGFIAAVFSFIFVCIGVAVILSLPSLFLCQLLLLCGRDNIRRAVKIKKIPLIAFAAALIAILFVIIQVSFDFWPWYITEYSSVILLLVLALSAGVMTWIISWKLPRYVIRNGQREEIKTPSRYRYITAIFVGMAGLTISFPVSFVLNQVHVSSWGGGLFIIAVLLVVLLLSFLPSMVIYTDPGSGGNIRHQVYGVVFLLFLSFAFLFLLFPGMFRNIYFSSLKSIGMASTDVDIYAVNKSVYSPGMFPDKVWPIAIEDKSGWFYIKGVALFSLGDVSLLCPPYVRDVKQRYKQHNLDRFPMKINDIGSRHLRSAARSCVIVEAQQVRRWNTILDGINQLNR